MLKMTATDDAKQRAAATYNAAADFYDHPTNTFWENVAFIRRENIRAVEANVLYGRASA